MCARSREGHPDCIVQKGFRIAGVIDPRKGEQTLQLGGKGEPSRNAGIIERLLAEMIARHEQPAGAEVERIAKANIPRSRESIASPCSS